MPVAVVTDSTAYLPPEVVAQYGIEVVPCYVVLAGRSGREGEDVTPGDVARALAVRGQRVSTSRPTPGDFVAAYRRRLAAGADRVVSVHLSADLSGTWDAARLAAAQVGEHVVTVVDTRSTAMGTGFAVLAAARAAAAGADAAEVAAVANTAAARTRTLFVVDTLEHLRRGGRIGSAASLLGTALSIKPVLHVADGRVVPLERVRTTTRAISRMVQRAAEAAGGPGASVAVHHLAAADRAEKLAAQLREAIPGMRELHVSELGAVIGAHVGPGAVGVVVAPAEQPADTPEETAPDAERPED
ncbi:EDD domain protein, DegV family [Geodermatophilus saharensis]|uniref:EDD domain protein, DegV family n=1 Tax=Geodermatophilus saharensis TaxID=1137994 RepID=A0A239G4P6_9ACTN|nr:DegV family protein [Geodermatophilus saharensis]SNS64316.1 EDD domain protein, DegV family [Geodermatophilus saharensis]